MPQAELDLLADGRETLERWCASPRYRYLYPEGPNLAILLEAYQELDRRRIVGRVRSSPRGQVRALRRIVRGLARADALARHRRLRWGYPEPRVRGLGVQPTLVRRALAKVDADVHGHVQSRLSGRPDPELASSTSIEDIRAQRGLAQFGEALINEALADPAGLRRMHPQFLLFTASAPPTVRRYPIASFVLVKMPLRLLLGVFALLVLLYVGAYLVLNDQRLGGLVSTQVSGLVEGELQIQKIHWELPLIIDLVTGQPTHVQVEGVTIWEAYDSFGGERTRRTAWAKRLDVDVVVHEIIPWNRLGVPSAFEIPWALHFTRVRSKDEAWFIVREYDDQDDQGQTHTLLSLLDAFVSLDPTDPERRGLSFWIEDTQFPRATLDVDFRRGIEGWQTAGDLRDLTLELRYDAPRVETGLPVDLPLSFSVTGRLAHGYFALDDIEVPLEDFELERLACGMEGAPMGDVRFAGQGMAADSPLVLSGVLADAFTRRLQPGAEPLPIDATVSYGDLSWVELNAGSTEPAELAEHIERQLGLAPDTIAANEGAQVWAVVDGPLSDPAYHLAAQGLTLDLMGEPAWAIHEVDLSVDIETRPLPERWRDRLAVDATRLVARFDAFNGTALNGRVTLDHRAEQGALVVFPEDDEPYLIAAPLVLEDFDPSKLSPDSQEVADTLAGRASGRVDLRHLELGTPPPDPDDDTDPDDDADPDSPPDDDFALLRAEIGLAELRLVRDRGPQADGLPRRLRADGTVIIDASGAIDLDGVVLRTDGTELRATGGVDATLSTLSETELALRIDDGPAFARAFAIDPSYFSTLRADLSVMGSTGAPNGGDGSLWLAGLGVQGGTPTQASMWMDRGVLSIHAPRAHLFEGSGSVDASVTLFERGAVSSDPKLRATADLHDVDLAKLAPGAGLAGTADIQLVVGDAQGKAVPISKLEVRGEARVPALRFGGTRYRDASVRFSLEPEQITIEELVLPVHQAVSPFHDPQITIPIGTIMAQGTVGLGSDPALDLDVSAKGVPLRLVARLLEVDVPVRGRVGGGTQLQVGGTVGRPSVAGTVQLAGLSAQGIALGSGALEVTSQDLDAVDTLAAHRELRVEGELSSENDEGIQWTIDAVVALGELPSRRRGGASTLPPVEAQVDVRFARIALPTLLRGVSRGTGTTAPFTGRLDQLGARVLTCDPAATMLSDCVGDQHEDRSLEVSLQLDKVWVASREPTTTDPCRDPGVLCTNNDLQATIDWPTIELDHPWRWSTGGATPAQLTLTGNFDLSTPPPVAAATAPARCRAPGLDALRSTPPDPTAARAEVHGGVDLAVLSELFGSDTLGRTKGRVDVDLSLLGPAAEATLFGRVTLPEPAPGKSVQPIEIDVGELGLAVEELDLRIDDHWVAVEGSVRVMGESVQFGSVQGDHSGFAFGGPCEGQWGVALEGTVGSRIINQLLGDGTATKGSLQVPRVVARGNIDAEDPIEELSGSVRLGRKTLTLDLDEGLPGVELTSGRVDFERCGAGHCPPEIEAGSLALYVAGADAARSKGRPPDAVRAKIGPRGTAFAWGTAYLAPDFTSVDRTRVVMQLEDVPYRGYDQRGRPVYEAEMTSNAVTLEGGAPLVVAGDIEVDRARYVLDAVQGVEILRFTDDVDLPSAPPPELVRNLQFDLRVQTHSPLRVENNVAHGVEADAIVDVTGSYDAPEFTGRVDVEPGGTVDIPFLTGTYEIQRGRVTLLRDLADAEVDVLALRRELVYIDEQPRQVYLLLGGTADAITWQCIAEGDTSGAVDTQRGCLDYLVLGAGDVQTSPSSVQRTGGGGLANARKPLQVVGHVTEFDFGRRIVEAEPRFGPYVPDIRLRLGQIGPELEIATPAEWLDFDYVTGTGALDYTRGYPGFLLQQSREMTFKLEAIDLLVFEVSRDIRSYLNNRIIFDPLQQNTVEFRVDFEIPSLR